MTKITNKESIFAAYWNAKIVHPCDNCGFQYRGVQYTSDVDSPKPRLYGDWSGGTNPELSCESYADWDECKLKLHALSALTQEHGKIIAEMFGGTWAKVDGNFVQIIKDDGFVAVYFILGGNIPIKLVDKLREWCYNVGYCQYSPAELVELGIAIEID